MGKKNTLINRNKGYRHVLTLRNALCALCLLFNVLLFGQKNEQPQKIFFDIGSSEIGTAEKQKINRLIDARVINNSGKVLLYGFTDYLGSIQYNKVLAKERANVVRDYLIAKGINPQNIPIVLGFTSQGSDAKKRNRRRMEQEDEVPGSRGNPQDRRVDIITDKATIGKIICDSMNAVARFPFQSGFDAIRIFDSHPYFPNISLPDATSSFILGNGDTYFGPLDADGRKTGWGIYRYANYDEYRGNLSHDTINGFGTYVWANQDYARGWWVNGELIEGQVVINTKSGKQVISGHFKPGVIAPHNFAFPSDFVPGDTMLKQFPELAHAIHDTILLNSIALSLLRQPGNQDNKTDAESNPAGNSTTRPAVVVRHPVIHDTIINNTLYVDSPIHDTVVVNTKNEVISSPKPNSKPETTGDCGDLVAIKGTRLLWTTRNLDVATYRDGQAIRQAKNKKDWIDCDKKEEGCWCYYNFDSTNGPELGKLYNFYAIKDKKGLAPEGYDIPSVSDFNRLLRSVRTGKEAGKKLKSKMGWNGAAGSNESCFNGLPGGYVDAEYGSSAGLGICGIWWTKTRCNENKNKCYSFQLSDTDEPVSGAIYKNYRNAGFSVRCIKVANAN